MSRGYWTYHHTYKAGCCGGPSCCVVALLAIPVWPLLCGFAVIKESVTPKTKTEFVSEVDEVQTASEAVEVDADNR